MGPIKLEQYLFINAVAAWIGCRDSDQLRFREKIEDNKSERIEKKFKRWRKSMSYLSGHSKQSHNSCKG